jgi:hypothetical protein
MRTAALSSMEIARSSARSRRVLLRRKPFDRYHSKIENSTVPQIEQTLGFLYLDWLHRDTDSMETPYGNLAIGNVQRRTVPLYYFGTSHISILQR